jgi:hypothetical protein
VLAPGGSKIRNAGRRQQAENRAPAARSGFLLLDILDDLGHVVLVLAHLAPV